MTIIHFTTLHPRTDTRIRLKEVATLAREFPAPVMLFVQDGKGDEEVVNGGYSIRDTGAPPLGRARRMTLGAWRMYRAVLRERPNIAHFHDPELLPWAVLLRLAGVRVIYDAHEDLGAAILSKPYIPPMLRAPISVAVRLVEKGTARCLSAVVGATPAIERNFSSMQPTLVQNFPMLAELALPSNTTKKVPPHFAYVGGLAFIRGAIEMVEAIADIKDSKVRLQIGGGFPADLGEELTKCRGWPKVDFHGWVGRQKVAEILSSCRAGLVLFHPEPNHVEAQPNKMFEYMAAGLPVIASDFPLWREIVDGSKCGLLVDPLNPAEISNAMQWILDNPEEAVEMGQRGREAVERYYNWEAESVKLVSLYRRLTSPTQ